MRRKILLIQFLLAAIVYTANAQYRPPVYNDRASNPNYSFSNDGEGSQGFDPNKLFIGGNLSLGFGSGYTNIGGTPEIGYSLNKMLDAGVILNLTYQTISSDYNYGVSQQSFNYGVGAFARFWPVNFLFLTLQPEENWGSYTLKYPDGSKDRLTTSATSLIAGIGYGQRNVGQSGFYVLVGVDLMDDKYSPYRDSNGTLIPIFKAGFNFYLHSNR